MSFPPPPSFGNFPPISQQGLPAPSGLTHAPQQGMQPPGQAMTAFPPPPQHVQATAGVTSPFADGFTAAAAAFGSHAMPPEPVAAGGAEEHGGVAAPPFRPTVASNPPAQRRQQQESHTTSAGEPSDVEFFPRAPLYTGRVLALGLAALLPLVPAFGSFPVAIVLTVGTAAVYLSDLLGFRRATLWLLFATVALVWIGFALGHAPGAWSTFAPVIVLANSAFILLLLAAWAVLHVRWVQLAVPELVVRLERIVLGLLPLAALPSLVSTCCALCGGRYAAFGLVFAMMALHRAFYWRLPSSFAVYTKTRVAHTPPAGATGSRAADEFTTAQQQQRAATARQIKDVCFATQPPESAFFAIATLLLPLAVQVLLLYPSTHAKTAPRSLEYHRRLLALNCAALFATPILYFLLFPHRSLWFLLRHPYENQVPPPGWLPKVLIARHNALHWVLRYRRIFVSLFYGVGVYFFASRLVTSRYAFYFTGYPYPLNFWMLVTIGMSLPSLFVLSRELLEETHAARDGDDADAAAEDVLMGRARPTGGMAAGRATQRGREALYTAAGTRLPSRRAMLLYAICIFFSITIAVAVTTVLAMPPFFVLVSVLSITSLWSYFLDRRRNGGQFTMFVLASSMTLLWWLFRSFSYLQQDLRVFGADSTMMSTQVLAVWLLWVYVMGAAAFPLSFRAHSKGLLAIILVLHSQKIYWLERLLYSQPDDNLYPAAFVMITTIVGVAVGRQLFRSGVLDPFASCLIVGAYLSKLALYAVDAIEMDERWFAHFYDVDAAGGSATTTNLTMGAARVSTLGVLRELVESQASWVALSALLWLKWRPSLAAVLAVLTPRTTESDAASETPEARERRLAATQAARQAATEVYHAQTVGGIIGVSVCVYLFALASTPTLVKFIGTEILRMNMPSRVQLYGLALALASVAALACVFVFMPGANVLHTLQQAAGAAAASTGGGATPVGPSKAQLLRAFAIAASVGAVFVLVDPPVEGLWSVFGADAAVDARRRQNAHFDSDDYATANRAQSLLPESPFMAPWWARWVLILCIVSAAGFRVLLGAAATRRREQGGTSHSGMSRQELAQPALATPIRVVLWTALALTTSLCFTGMLIVMADMRVYIALFIFVWLMMLALDQAHYSPLDKSESCTVLYMGALVSFVAGVYLMGTVDVHAVTTVEIYVLDALRVSRAGVIGLLAAANFAFAVLVKSRLRGASLLPGPVALASGDAVGQVASVLNYAVLVGAFGLCILCSWTTVDDAAYVMLAAGQLLLLEEDGAIFPSLNNGLRRYFPSFVCAAIVLWFHAGAEVYHFWQQGLTFHVRSWWMTVPFILPTQCIVAYALFQSGSSDPRVSRAAAAMARGLVALVMLLIDLGVIALTSSPYLRMLSAANLVGQVCRFTLLEDIMVKVRDIVL